MVISALHFRKWWRWSPETKQELIRWRCRFYSARSCSLFRPLWSDAAEAPEPWRAGTWRAARRWCAAARPVGPGSRRCWSCHTAPPSVAHTARAAAGPPTTWPRPRSPAGSSSAPRTVCGDRKKAQQESHQTSRVWTCYPKVLDLNPPK